MKKIEHIIKNDILLKICKKCNLSKDLSNFRKDKSRWDGLYAWCKKCSSIKDNKFYLKNRDKKLKQQKASYSELIKAPEKKIKISIHSKKSYLKRKLTFKKRAQDLKRRALLINANKNFKITNEVIDKLIKKFGKICVYCNKSLNDFTIDHMLPLCRGGDNSFNNLTISCKSCNSSKGKKLLGEWRNSKRCKGESPLPILAF